MMASCFWVRQTGQRHISRRPQKQEPGNRQTPTARYFKGEVASYLCVHPAQLMAYTWCCERRYLVQGYKKHGICFLPATDFFRRLIFRCCGITHKRKKKSKGNYYLQNSQQWFKTPSQIPACCK